MEDFEEGDCSMLVLAAPPLGGSSYGSANVLDFLQNYEVNKHHSFLNYPGS